MESTTAPVDKGFADVDDRVSEMTPGERTQRLRQIELQQRALAAEAAALVDHNDRAGEHRADGHRSMVGYLRSHLNCSAGAITRMRRCARLFRAHPEVGDALWSGRVGLDQAAELARAHSNPRCGHLLGESLHILLQHAHRLKFDEFREVVKRWEMFADLDGAHRDGGGAVAARTAMVAAGSDGVDLVATGGTALQAAGMRAILDRFIDAEYQVDRAEAKDRLGDDASDAELARTHSQRAFDALVKLFHTANDSPLQGTPPAAIVEIVVDQYSFERQLALHGLAAEPTDLVRPDPAHARCHTDCGVPIHPEDAIAAAILGHVRRVVVDSRSVVVDLGRKERLFKGAAAHAARMLATRCDNPGCTLPEAWCQIDHMTEWEDHGRTNQDNAAIFCGHDNRAKHRLKLTARRDRYGNVRLQRRDGTWIVPVGVDPPTGDDFDTPEQRAHRIGARLLEAGYGQWTAVARAA